MCKIMQCLQQYVPCTPEVREYYVGRRHVEVEDFSFMRALFVIVEYVLELVLSLQVVWKRLYSGKSAADKGHCTN